uniref:NADH:ubiquinone reductase (H(+)-translocating) n=1 Tax=Gangesia oligonchis TaxID=1240673 RepID=A0A6C0MD17_9CEST|nr:NADH dehydrogenase subunit 5 [Gangesia oligonchis]QHV34459.1 NADH dehydrogenase subunit 5 [Gangesia oligonchis]
MFVLFLVFLGFSVFCFSCVCGDHNWVVSILDLTMNGTFWNMVFSLDSVTLSVLLMLSICFGYAFFYTGHYFCGDLLGVELNKIICLFVGVMASLVITGDFLSTLIFWEYLGVVSFFLILFYSNYLSLRASVVTLVSSRFGDVSLFLLIALSVYSGYYMVAGGILIFFIVFSKSAGFPFISWLLEAMRAPTPVSSLVHSSTLVAAGVWFAMRYDMFLYINDSLLYSLLFITTIGVTGICCFFFLDLKKIVALSTCNNIAWCVLYLIYGDVVLSLFQLVSHGVSKCLLFMLVGDVMSGSGGSQASNCVYSPQLYGNWGLFGLFSVILGLSGAPFVGVFFTKHFLLSGFNSSINLVLFLAIGICVFFSYFYSFRLCRVLMNLNTSLVSGVMFSFGSGVMVYFWLFINFIIASTLDEATAVGSILSFSLVIFQVLSCATAYSLYSSTLLSGWSSGLFGCDNLVELVYSAYLFCSNILSIFFYRWDNSAISLLSGNGVGFIRLVSGQMLNILLFSLLFFIFCWFLFVLY